MTVDRVNLLFFPSKGVREKIIIMQELLKKSKIDNVTLNVIPVQTGSSLSNCLEFTLDDPFACDG